MDGVELAELLKTHDLPDVMRWLQEHPPHVIAAEIVRVDPSDKALTFRLLDKQRALTVFEELGASDQQDILAELRDKAFWDLVENMHPDDRARLVGEAPAKVAKRVLAGLSTRERQMTAALLGYPEGSVGRVMTPEVVALHRTLSVEQALEIVRLKGVEAETVYTLPIVDDGRRLVGVVSLREVVTAPVDSPISDLAGADECISVRATDSAEDAAVLMQDANLLDLPVVDSEDRLVGLLTIDDAVDVIRDAATEDAYLQSASEPLEGSYLSASVAVLARRRVVWLMLLIVAATLTVNVLDHFEDSLVQVTALALFIPLITGTGGNAGAQSATSVVRALATDEIRVVDLGRVIWREGRVGVLLGLGLACVGLAVGTLAVGADLAVVVAISLVAVCAWATVVGATMPLLAKRLRVDPAVVSAPMVTTLVDATGLIIYFLTAQVVLGL